MSVIAQEQYDDDDGLFYEVGKLGLHGHGSPIQNVCDSHHLSVSSGSFPVASTIHT